MESLFQTEVGEKSSAKMSRQAASFFIHTALAIVSWLALMFAGYALNPAAVSQTVILVLSILVPAVAGYIVTIYRQGEMATLVWLVGIIWLLIVSLWILDMPTGPNRCLQCDATEKLSRTFLSLPQPSGLIDDDGPFLGTWPAAALFGYAIGARFGLRPPKEGK
jgi:prepilin signal peptidase PulO-like enzyme (type II secretory pathway)